MFKRFLLYIREFFGYDGKQKIIYLDEFDMFKFIKCLFKKEDTKVEEEPVEEVFLNISEPVLTIVAKIKENPKRLKFTYLYDVAVSDKWWSVQDITTGMICRLHVRPWHYVAGSGEEMVLYFQNEDFVPTIEEHEYIIRELRNIYYPHYLEYKKVCDKRKELNQQRKENKKRKEILKLWEGEQ